MAYRFSVQHALDEVVHGAPSRPDPLDELEWRDLLFAADVRKVGSCLRGRSDLNRIALM